MNELWEILVPTTHPITGKPIRTRFHRVWDAKVRAISGGLTILTPTKGQWTPPEGSPNTTLSERMIPVRIACTREQIEKIIDITLKYYEQECVMCYKISDEVILRYANKKSRNQSPQNRG